MTSLNLFSDEESRQPIPLGPQAVLFRGYALPLLSEALTALNLVTSASPFRHMLTPGGRKMSVALTNCGSLGWVSDSRGYRYARIDPLTNAPWPAMPYSFLRLARTAAETAGFSGFAPDACLINRYLPGARLSLHQDQDERDFSAPIVSVSLGMTATFLFGGLKRNEPARRALLQHGDVVVWGGADRLRYHGILPIKGPGHPELGEQRINFTFRKAG